MGEPMEHALGQGAILALTETALPDALFVHRFDGRLIEVNRRACISLGYRREELLQLTVLDIDRSFDLATAQELWSAMEPGRPQLVRTTHCRRDGSLFPVEVSFGVVDEGGDRIFVGVARDLTDRIAHEHALRFAQERMLATEREERQVAARLAAEAEGRYQRIIEAMSEGMLLIDADGRISTANPAASRILGVPRDSLLGLGALDTDWDAVREDGTPLSVDETPPVVARRSGRPVAGVVIGIRDPLSGGRRWVRATSLPVSAGEGEQPAILTTFVDVTELRQDEAALRLAASVFTHVREGIVILDVAQAIVDVNAAFLRLTGWQREDLVGRGCGMLHEPDRRGARRHEALDALRADGTWAGEVRLVRRAGEPVAARLTVTAVADRTGATQHYVCLYTGAPALLDLRRRC